MSRIFWISLFLIICVACSGPTVYDQQLDFPSKTWQMYEPQSFVFEIEDNEANHMLSILLRNTFDYPMQNIYIKASLRDSLGQELAEQLINLPLFEEKTGRPLNKGLSNIATHTHILWEAMKFPHEGTYEVQMEQYMRIEELKGLLSLGLRIEKQQ